MSYQIFEKLLKANQTTVYRVAKATGISATTFTDWKNGRSTPKLDKLRRIADYFGVSLEELIGEIPGGEAHREYRIPVIGEIRAGYPIITTDTLLGYEYAEVEESEDYFYFHVDGDSMKNIGMVDGSLVLFHKQQYAEDGEIVACLLGGNNATVKRFRKTGKNIYLLPENEDYAPIHLSTDDFESGEARILGVAREIRIRL